MRFAERGVELGHPDGRLIFIHLRCWEVLPFLTSQRQRCIKILCPKDPEFHTPLALNCQKGQHLPALEVYKNQSPTSGNSRESGESIRANQASIQEPLNAPFLNGLFSRGFSRGKTAHQGIPKNGPLRSENGPLRTGNAPINANGQFSGTPEVRPFCLSDNSIYPLFLALAITALGGPGGYFSLVIIAFGAFEFSVPKYEYRLGNGIQ